MKPTDRLLRAMSAAMQPIQRKTSAAAEAVIERERRAARAVKRKAYRVVHPDLRFAILFVVVSFLLLMGCFELRLYATPLAWPVYGMTTYAVLLIVAEVLRVMEILPQIQNPLVRWYLDDVEFRTRITFIFGFVINFCFAAVKILIGLRQRSSWLFALGVYHIALGIVQVTLLTGSLRDKVRVDLYYRMIGGLLLGLGASMSAIFLHVIFRGETYKFPGFMIYFFAVFAFYKLTVAIIAMVRRDRKRGWFYSASRRLAFCTAVMSMFALQNALVGKFGDDVRVAYHVSAVTGAAVMACIIFMGLEMIRGSRKFKNA